MRSTAVRLALSLVVAAGLIALLLHWSGTDLVDLRRRLLQLDGGTLALSTAILAGIYLVRGLRFRALLGPGLRPPLGRLLAISGVHGLAAYLAPAKLGEAVLVLLLRRAGVSGSHGLAVLIVARLLDLASVAGCLGIACLTLAGLGRYPELTWLFPLGGLLLVLTLVVAVAGLQGPRLAGMAVRVLRALGLARTLLGQRVLALVERVGTALGEVRRGALLVSVAISVLVWAGVYLYYAVLARAFGLAELDLAEAVFGSSLAVLANLLPINGFAGFGTQDAGWVAGFTALGADPGLATESALAFHLVYVGHIALFGLLGHLLLVALGRARAEAPAGPTGPPAGEPDRLERLP